MPPPRSRASAYFSSGALTVAFGFIIYSSSLCLFTSPVLFFLPSFVFSLALSLSFFSLFLQQRPQGDGANIAWAKSFPPLSSITGLLPLMPKCGLTNAIHHPDIWAYDLGDAARSFGPISETRASSEPGFLVSEAPVAVSAKVTGLKFGHRLHCKGLSGQAVRFTWRGNYRGFKASLGLQCCFLHLQVHRQINNGSTSISTSTGF